MIAAVRPQRTSAIENVALSAAITTSQAATRPVPPPKQRALHQRDGRHRRAVEPLHRLGGGARDADVLLARGGAHRVDPFQVGAGLEVLAVALDDDGAQAGGLLPSASSAASRPSISSPL